MEAYLQAWHGSGEGNHYRQSNKRASYSMDLLQTKRFTPGIGMYPVELAAAIATPPVPIRRTIKVQLRSVQRYDESFFTLLAHEANSLLKWCCVHKQNLITMSGF